MKKLVVALAAVFCVSRVIASDFSVRLHVIPATSVVGIPPTISVEITNNTSRALATPMEAALLVSPADGSEPFFALSMIDPLVAADPSWNDAPHDLDAGESTTLEFPSDLTLRNPVWFLDERLRSLGSYVLQVALLPTDVRPADFRRPSTAPLVGELKARGFLSAPLTFTIAPPRGDDADVCELVSRRFHEAGCPVHRIGVDYALIDNIRSRYPASSYIQYLLSRAPVGNDPEKRAALYESAVSAVGKSAVGDWYRWLLADLHERWSLSKDITAEAAEEHGRAAQALWETLSKSSLGALRKNAINNLRERATSHD